MIGGCAAAESRGKLFGGFARGSVDDGGAIGFFFEEIGGELVAAGLGELDDLDGEVVSTEAVDEEFGFSELKLSDDVFLDRGCCGRCEGDYGCGAKSGEEVAEGAVVGAKVVAPGGDAVGLVDGDETRLAPGEHLREVGNAHALGCDEEELQGAVEVIAAGLAGLVTGEAGVDAGDAKTGGGEFGGLVVHEGDERRDHQGGTTAGDGGELVAEGLACSGGHDEEDVAAVGGGATDGFLIGAKGWKAKGRVEQGGEVHRLVQFRILFVARRRQGAVK